MVNVSSGQTYVIANKKSGTVCDLSGSDGKSIIGFRNQGSENQKWKVSNKGGSFWTLQNAKNDMYLDFEGSDPANGTKVVGVPKKADQARTWEILSDEKDNDGCRIFVPGTQFNVDLSDGGNSNNNTPVTLWDKWAGENQVWLFKEAST